jgi:hypothetical protein
MSAIEMVITQLIKSGTEIPFGFPDVKVPL